MQPKGNIHTPPPGHPPSSHLSPAQISPCASWTGWWRSCRPVASSGTVGLMLLLASPLCASFGRKNALRPFHDTAEPTQAANVGSRTLLDCTLRSIKRPQMIHLSKKPWFYTLWLFNSGVIPLHVLLPWSRVAFSARIVPTPLEVLGDDRKAERILGSLCIKWEK